MVVPTLILVVSSMRLRVSIREAAHLLNCVSSVALGAESKVQKDKTLSNFPLSGLDTFGTLNFTRLRKVFPRSAPELVQAHGVAET